MKKRLRPLERMVADSCRLFATRPAANTDADPYRAFATSFVELNLSLLLFEQARISGDGWSVAGPEAVQLKELKTVPEGATVVGAGRITYSRRGRATVERRFTLECPMPSRLRTPHSIAPSIRILGLEQGTA